MRRVREAQGKSLTDLSHDVRMNLSHLSRIEKGHVRPHAPTVKRIADALGVAPLDIPLPGEEPAEGLSPVMAAQVRQIVREEIAAALADRAE